MRRRQVWMLRKPRCVRDGELGLQRGRAAGWRSGWLCRGGSSNEAEVEAVPGLPGGLRGLLPPQARAVSAPGS